MYEDENIKKAKQLMRNQARVNRALSHAATEKYYSGGVDAYDAQFKMPSEYTPTDEYLDQAFEKQKKQISTTDSQLEESENNSGWNFAKKFMNDLLHQNTEGAMSDLMNNSFEIEQINKIKEYQNLIERRNKLLENTKPDSQDIITLQELNRRISEYDKWFTGEGRRSEVVRKLLYDRNGKDGEVYLGYAFNDAINKGYDIYQQEEAKKKILQDPDAMAKLVQSGNINQLYDLVAPPGATEGFRMVNSAFDAVVDAIWGAGKHIFDKDGELDEAVKTARQDSKLIRFTYKGFQKQYSPVSDDQFKSIQKQLDQSRQNLINTLREKISEEQEGRFSILGIPFKYDTKVDEQWLKEDEKFGEHWYDFLTSPGHAVASTASTVGLFKYQLYTMGYEAMTKWAIKELGEFAITRGGGKASKLANAAAQTLKWSAPVAGIAGAALSRQNETALEAVGAYTERVLQEAEANGADLQKIYQSINSRLNEIGDGKLDGMSFQDKLKLGIVLGIKGDEAWNDALDKSQYGLQKLINANNAKAIQDYVMTLPYLASTGRVVEDGVKKFLLKNTSSKLASASPAAVDRLFRSRKVQEVFENSFLSPTGWISRQIDKGAAKFLKKDFYKYAGKANKFRDFSKYFVNRLPFAFGQSFKESVEEGQQELLQLRYKRGEYDNTFTGDPFFSLDEVITNWDLGRDAVFDYLGINYGDIDNSSENVRKAMNIGFASSLLFSNATHFVSNFNPMDNSTRNLKSLFKDFKASNVARNIITNSAANEDLREHANIFYQALHNGVNSEKLKEHIQFLMDNKSSESQVTQEMVDEDLALIDNIAFMYNNKALRDAHREHSTSKRDKLPIFKRGIYGEDHQFDIINGALKLTQLDQAQKAGQSQGRNINRLQRQNATLLNELLDPNVSEEEKQNILSQFPHIGKLYQKFNELYDKEQASLSQKKQETVASIQRLLNIVLHDPSQSSDVTQQLTKVGLDDLDIQIALTNVLNGNPISNEASNLYRRATANTAKQKVNEQIEKQLENAEDETKEDIRKSSFLSNAKLRNFVRSKILKQHWHLSNRELETRVNEELEQYYGDQDKLYIDYANYYEEGLPKQQFFQRMLRQYHVQMQSKSLAKASSFANNQRNMLNQLRATLGLNIDTTKLKGISEAISDMIKAQSEKLQKIYEKTEDNPFNDEYFDFDDDFTKDYLDQLIGYQLKLAAINPLRETASAYRFGVARPTTLRQAIFGKNNSDPTEFDDLVDEFTKAEKELKDTDNIEDVIERTTKKSAAQSDLNTIAKKSAWKYLQSQRDAAEQISRINRREQIQEALENSGETSDTNAVDEVDNVLNPNTQRPQARSTQRSEAESALREQYLHENSQTEQRRQEAILRREQELLEQQQNDQQQEDESAEETNQSVNPSQESNDQQHNEETSSSVLSAVLSPEDEALTETGVEQDPEPDAEEDELSTVLSEYQDPHTILTSLYNAEEGKHDGFTLSKSEDSNRRSYTIQIDNSERKDNEIAQNLLNLPGYESDAEDISLDEVHSIRITEANGTITDIAIAAKNTSLSSTNIATGERTDGVLKLIHITPIETSIDDATINANAEAESSLEQSLDEILAANDADQQISDNDLATLDVELQQKEDQQGDQEAQIDEDFDQAIYEGWVEIPDITNLDIDERGNMTYNGVPLSAQQSSYIRTDLEILAMLEDGSITQNQIPIDDRLDDKVRRQYVNDAYIGNYLANTFFYAVDKRKNTSMADEGTTDVFNGAKLPKTIGTAAELSSKLSTYGWFTKAKKYYIVTKSNRVDSVRNKDHINDAYTVSLILEDDEKCYITSLRDLGISEYEDANGKKQYVNNELKWRNWLQTKNLNIALVQRELGKPLSPDHDTRKRQISDFLKKQIKERARLSYIAASRNQNDDGFEDFYNNGTVTSNNQGLLSLRKSIIEGARRLELMRFGLNGNMVMDDQAIDKQIASLRELRNTIIDLYGDPTTNGEVKTTVVPEYAQQSNGQVNNVRDKFGNPVLRPIISQQKSLDEVTDEIEAGQLIFGLGRGALSVDRFAIVPLLDSQKNVTNFPGLGRSGKIYLYVKPLIDRANNGKMFPIMLTEHKFDKQTRVKNGKQETRYGIKPCLKLLPNGQLINATNVDQDGYQYLPSEAEVLFYMITHKFDFGQSDNDKINSIVEFFIHTGDKTLFNKNTRYDQRLQPGSEIFKTFSSKQIAWLRNEQTGENELHIAFQQENGYEVTVIPESELFEESEEGEAIRLKCINSIAQQMHWNTDQDHINSDINPGSMNRSEMSQFVKYLFDTQAKSLKDCGNDVQEYLNQTVSILGCPDLTFRLGDFYEDNSQNSLSNPIKPKSVNTLAWMLKNGKLVTDVGNPIFKDPFVFSFGAKSTQTVNRTETTPTQETANQNDVSTNIFLNQDKLNQAYVDFGDSEEDKEHIASTEEERKEILKNRRDGAIDNILLQSLNIPSDVDVQDAVASKVYEFIKAYEKQHGISFGVESSEDDELIQKIQKIESAFDEIENDDRKVTIKVLKKDGKYTYAVGTQSVQPLSETKSFFTGVYSAIKGSLRRKGSVNIDDARKWLKETLGINEYNVIVSNAAIRGAVGEAYGVTTVAIDAITGELVGRIGLSTIEGSKDVHFHEAWHYVNLLLHDKKQRYVIYDEYVKTHKELRKPGITYKQVEEAMAEEFLEYMAGKLDNSLLGKVKRFFRNAMDYINLVLDRKRYRQIFEKINQGEYKNANLNNQAIQEFLMNYEIGANKITYDVSGFTKEQLDKLTHIDTHQELFEGIDTIVNYSMIKANLQTIEDMYDFVKGDMFKQIVRNIDIIINDLKGDFELDELDDETVHKIEILEDIKNNKDVLKSALAQKFETLGFEAKFKKISKKNQSKQDLTTEVNNETGEKEDGPDNPWDKLELTESRKDNAGTKVKFFLATIPKYVSRLNKKGEIRSYPDVDRFGVPKLWDFDRVWSALCEDLSACDSYAELDKNGKYASHSLRGIVKRLSAVDPLYKAIDAKLDQLDKTEGHKNSKDDSELKSMLYGIFNAHRNHIQTINLSDPMEYENTDIDSFEPGVIETRAAFTTSVADTSKLWNFSDDGQYNPGWSLPRKWSQNLLSLGLAEFDKATKKTVISGTYYNKINKHLKDLQTLSQNIAKNAKNARSEQELDKAYGENLYSGQKLIPKLINLLNELGMPVDASVMSMIISKKSNITENRKLTNKEIYETVDSILQSKKVGSLDYILNAIKKGVGKSEIQTKDHKDKTITKDIDQVLNNFALSSDIGIFALSYAAVYPSLKELSAKSASGDNLYPVNLNNYLSDGISEINHGAKDWAENKRKCAYNQHSIICAAADEIRESIQETQLRLNTFVGIKHVSHPKGSDYLQITPMEDYLAKMMMVENDNLIFPTMADKKTWYSLSVGASARKTKDAIGDTHRFHLSHDTIIGRVKFSDILNTASSYYMELVEPFDKQKHKNEFDFKYKFVYEWYKQLGDEQKQQIYQETESNLKATHKAYRRFSNETIDIFCGYFLDELNSLIEYYSQNRINSVTRDANQAVTNFDGKVHDGIMEFGGNGGLFRYFYDVILDVQTNSNFGNNFNLNQRLQALYQLEQSILSKETKNENAEENDVFTNSGLIIPSQFVNKNGYDGFELIREYLFDLKNAVTQGNDNFTENLRDAINAKLIKQTDEELNRISDPNSPLYLVIKTSDGRYIPRAIPTQMLTPYIDKLREQGRADYGNIYTPVGVASNTGSEDALYSLIANYVANSAISIIEVEKIFSGDPAYYKYKNSEEEIQSTISYQQGDVSVNVPVTLNVLSDCFGDKIKRLGGTLSPGTELRLDYSASEIQSDIDTVKKYFSDEAEVSGHAILGGSKYTVLDVEDIECQSEVLDFIKKEFIRQTVIDFIRCGKLSTNYELHDLYFDDKKFNAFYESVKNKTFAGNTTVQQAVEAEVKSMSKPYSRINVADAQVFIRPAMYRKIRKALGDWTAQDEEAFWIMESSDNWMSDPIKARKVAKFQQYALKMSYFANDIKNVAAGVNLSIPIYNKMAIFPLFKFQTSTDTGVALYNRMNKAGNELDMIAFKSAVKAGSVQNGLQLIDKKANTQNAVSKLSKELDYDSNVHLNYNTDEEHHNSKKKTLAVKVQDLHDLRLQLNTHAHEDMIRAIGTQMFKIAFSNTFDNELYGNNKDGRTPRFGKDIKDDIMRLINKLTAIGASEVVDRFYDVDEFGNATINEEAIKSYVQAIVQNNGLGALAEQIVNAGGKISSLMSRTVFEQSISKYVNDKIVNINTNGGTAIQQSMIGFGEYSKQRGDLVGYGDKYVKYNNGQNLKWNANEGSMEVILSIKFFKGVVPKQYQGSYEQMRQWLIDNDVIKGYKSAGFEELTDEQTRINEQLNSDLSSLNLDEDIKTLLTEYIKNGNEEKQVTVLDALKKYKKAFKHAQREDSKFKIKQATSKFEQAITEAGLTTESSIISPKAIIGTEMSNPKPFGIGYRIPTQGMSSMFSFTVADVLPHQVGDLIIVPREFTAQTGSDFDVDKLYLATMSYKDGVLERESEDESANTNGAYTNELLLNYMDIISDPKNFAQSRGSIDVFTSILKDELLRELRDQENGYLPGMNPLLPSFQAYRKMEFSTGKNGIGPFALNVTNLSLTQHAHLTIDFGTFNQEDETYGEFHLKPFDAVYGKDGRMIAGWLSAMVNAHVDVAKDPYIFDLNVNQVTYNMANFLIRTGNGLASFAFLAQPILKLYAQTVNQNSGIYGKNINGGEITEQGRNRILQNVSDKYLTQLEKVIAQLSQIEGFDVTSIADIANVYQHFKVKKENRFKSKDQKQEVPKLNAHLDQVLTQGQNINSLQLLKQIDALQNSLNGITDEKLISDIKKEILQKKAAHYAYQLLTAHVFSSLSTYAQAMSTMVTCSQIDTKKFGNDIVSQQLWLNKYLNNRYEHTVKWIINTEEFRNSQPKDEKGNVDHNASSDKALDIYFENLYLHDKLSKAVHYTRDILKRESIVATDVYSSIFIKMMQDIYGYKVFEDLSKDLDKRKIGEGFGAVVNQDNAKALATGLENISRFNWFMHYGNKIYQDEVANNPNTQMIDFTFGGDTQAMIDKMQELYFGKDDKASIFERYANLLKDMKENPVAKDASGRRMYTNLVDRNGTITNELLNYLIPLMPTKNCPVGRIHTFESQMNVPSNIKTRYSSAFSMLLMHPNSEVRELAKDLVYFAYFSSYDQNTPGSFFDLVPLQYRAQYDLSIKEGFEHLSDASNEDIERSAKVMLNAPSSMQGINKVKDILARNFWYNDDIVQPYSYYDQEADEQSSSIFLKKTGETILGYYYDPAARWSFPSAVISNKRVLENKEYFKLQHNGVSYVYKRIGRIYDVDPESNKQPFYIYAVIPKAGLHQKGVTQYEFYATYEEDSIFPQNRLPYNFSEEAVRKAVQRKVDAFNDNSKDVKLAVEYFTGETVSTNRLSSNLMAYSPKTESQDKQSNNAGATRIEVLDNPKTNPDFRGQKQADLIINITQSDSSELTKNVRETNESKTFNVQFGKTLDQTAFVFFEKLLADKLLDVVDDTASPVVIHFTTDISDFGFSTDNSNFPESIKTAISEQTEHLIQNAIDQYREDVAEDETIATVEERQALITTQESLLRSESSVAKFRKKATTEIMNNYISELISQLSMLNVPISTITTSATNKHTILSTSVSHAKANGSTMQNIQAKTFVSTNWVTSKETQRDYQIFLSNTRQQYQNSKKQSSDSETISQEEFDKLARSNDSSVEQLVEQVVNTINTVTNTEATDQVQQNTDVLQINEESKENDPDAQNLQCGGLMGAATSVDEGLDIEF